MPGLQGQRTTQICISTDTLQGEWMGREEMSVTIREATFEDLPTFAILDAEIFTVEGPWTLEDYQDDFVLSDRCYLIAEDDGKVVGYALACITDEVSELLGTAVIPEYRNQGIGKQLLEKRLAWLGNREVVLQTRTDNHIIQEMYKSYGFKPSQILKDYYREGVDAQEMIRAAQVNHG